MLKNTKSGFQKLNLFDNRGWPNEINPVTEQEASVTGF